MNDEVVQVIAEALTRFCFGLTTEAATETEARAVLAALKNAGYAVVKLPEHDEIDDDGQEWFSDYGIRVDNTGKARPGTIYTDFGMGSEFRTTISGFYARALAAALLAAANKAEEAQ